MLMKMIDSNNNNVVRVCSVFISMEVTFTDIAETSLILNWVKFFNTVRHVISLRLITMDTFSFLLMDLRE